jgi:Uncharacterized low-complexity proteins
MKKRTPQQYVKIIRYCNRRGWKLSPLRDADLRDAELWGANLRCANLRDANLDNVVMCWTSHNLIAERLRQAAANDPLKRMATGYIAMSTDWCWAALINNTPHITLSDGTTLLDWTLNTMAAWVRDGDNAPQILKKRRDKLPLSINVSGWGSPHPPITE